MNIKAFEFKTNKLEDFIGDLLPIKKNGHKLNVFSLNGNLIKTLDLPKELEDSFSLVPEKRVLVKEGEKKEEQILQLARFIDIHRHSGYSLLDGAIKIEDMTAKTELFGAISDHGNIFGALEYYKQMKKAGKKPIIGCEVYVENLDGQKERNHLILLVKNQQGYKNLCKILSIAEENKYYTAHTKYEVLEKYHEGLIATSACLGGEVARALADGDYDKALEVVENYQGIFGDDYYLEMQRHGIDKEKIVNPLIKKLSRETGVKVVGATDAHYLNKKDRIAHEVLLGIGTKKIITDADKFVFDGDGYHIHTPDEFEELFHDYPEAISNLFDLVDKIQFEFQTGKVYMPHFDIPEGFNTEEEYFRYLCKEGFKNKYIGTSKIDNQEYIDRLNHEMDIITSMQYEGYFLIVADFINFAKKRNIMVGPGRGSAAGSLVSYVLNIIDLDPIEHGLLFERFLNPDRISMPDIDVDFEDTRREEVLDYVRHKYGAASVSGIVTFGTFKAKSIIRDTAKYFDFTQVEIDKLRESIPDTVDMTLEKAYQQSPEFRGYIESSDRVKTVYEIALTLENLPRHLSKHACGYVIADGSVSDYVPELLIKDDNTGNLNRVASFNMSELEDLGLLKMDFLGLRNMTVIGESLRHINRVEGKEYTQENLEIYNPYIYDFIGTANTIGIFQLESPGMQSLMIDMFYDSEDRIKELESKYGCSGFISVDIKNPEADVDKYLEEMKELGQEYFGRLVAAISLYRPGPMEQIPQYLEGLRDPSSIHYDTIELEPILKNTYGVIVYQEQVQQIARTLAGYSLARGDLLRRAMGKKNMETMHAEQKIFIYGDEKLDIPGCLNNGIKEEDAITIWNKMLEFANYAFNKSHSAAYAKTCASTAFLKLYYPLYFYNSTFNSYLSDTTTLKQSELKIHLNDLKQNGYELKTPSVLYSDLDFTIEEEGIRFGLRGLRGLGKNAYPIIEEREAYGQFESLRDFVYRMKDMIQKRTFESLIYSGALDEFDHTGSRKSKIKSIESILEYSRKLREFEKRDEDIKLEELSLLYKDLVDFTLISDDEEFEKTEMLFLENHYAGAFITEHPVDKYNKKIQYLKSTPTHILNDEEEHVKYLNKKLKIVGILDLKKVYTKKNDLMFTGNIEDQTSNINVVIFPSNITESMYDLDDQLKHQVVMIEGKFQKNDFGPQLLIDEIIPMDEVVVERETAILIEVVNQEEINTLTEIVEEETGDIDVYIKTRKGILKYKDGIELNFSQELKLKEAFGNIQRAFK